MIFKSRTQNIECDFGCVARSAVLLKQNVPNIILFNSCEQKFVRYGPITIAIDCNGLSLLIFKEKWHNYAPGPKSAANSYSFWVCRLFNVGVRVFRAPNKTTSTSTSKWASSEKMNFFWPKSSSFVSRSQAHLAKRKCIGWSIGFNSWTNWTLYVVIPRLLCKNSFQWCLRNVQVFCHSSNILGYTDCFCFSPLGLWGCQFLSLFSQDNENTVLTVLLFFQNL